MLALSKDMKLYFWGQHVSEQSVVTPRRMEVPNVESIGATRGCSISAFKTTEGKVYYWGHALGHYISEPVATKYSTLIELFASLDSPMMLGPVEFHVNQPMTEKLKLVFDDSVRPVYKIDSFDSSINLKLYVFFRTLQISPSLRKTDLSVPTKRF